MIKCSSVSTSKSTSRRSSEILKNLILIPYVLQQSLQTNQQYVKTGKYLLETLLVMVQICIYFFYIFIQSLIQVSDVTCCS